MLKVKGLAYETVWLVHGCTIVAALQLCSIPEQ
jgi:hypothetical protein